MECACDLYSSIIKSLCQIGTFLVENAAIIGMVVLLVVCLVITLERYWNPDIPLSITIKETDPVNVGDTILLEGEVQFHHTLRSIKWQKSLRGNFVDINIHKSKYDGTQNDLKNPKLLIHEVDTDDEVDYRLEVQRSKTTEFSNIQRLITKTLKENPTIEIYSSLSDSKYYVGEDVMIRANFNNHSAILCITWQRESATGNFGAIDTTLHKYRGTRNGTENHLLYINNCEKSDGGIYFILATCTDGMEIMSNKIYLDISEGLPEVTLSHVPESLYNESVQIKATIRSYPKFTSVIWMKNKEEMDITDPKYEGSSTGDNYSILCINDVDSDDEDVYEVEITNDLGKVVCRSDLLKVTGEKPSVKLSKQSQFVTYGNTITLLATITARPTPSLIEWRKDDNIINVDDGKFVIDNSDDLSSKLSIRCLDFDDNGIYTVFVRNALGSTQEEIEITVKATKIIFISGPVVVLPYAKIQFQTVYPPSTKSAKGEWLITKNNVSDKLQFGAPGYCIKTSGSQPTIQIIEITNPVENGSAFQLSVETMKSNIINIFVDDSGKFATENEGNCIRFFELQSAAMEAMRKSLDSMSGTFQMKWVNFEKFCKHRKGKFLDLLPSNTPTSSSDLDVTVIYAMFRNTINISKPTKGWGQVPDKNDTKTADDIERVRLYRNKISHANSSEMKTDDFNESTLDLISAIQRLTAYDEQLIKKICVILNKLCCKGKELDKMMEDLNKFRDTATKRENILRETDGENGHNLENVSASDKQAIHLTGRSKLYVGETATVTAFINPNISTLSRVFWQKKNSEGDFYTIDINDGKYTGSTLELPTPQLYIHFIREEDEGMYRIVVDTFNYRVHNSIELEVKKGECDEGGCDEGGCDEVYRRLAVIMLGNNNPIDIEKALREAEAEEETGSESEEMIRFHQVHDSNIALLHDDTIARKKNGEDVTGTCFTNRPIKIGEHIFLRIAEIHAKWSSSMDFGVTNVNPSNIHLSPNESIESVLKRDRVEKINYLPDFNDVLRFTLNSNATLSLSINDIEQPIRHLEHVSVNSQVWLSFYLWGKTRAVEISSKKPKKKPWNSYFREYSSK